MDVLTKVVMEKGMGLSENSVDKCTGECVSICCIWLSHLTSLTRELFMP